MYGYIYKTTCIVNHKIYIGQKKSNKFLGKKYFGSGKELKNSIKKYGRQLFTVELLETCDTFEQLNDREIYWIDYYWSTNHDIGYNITTGGQGTPGVDPGYHKGMLGKRQSDVQKEAARKACSYKRSYDVKKRMSEAQTGKVIKAKRKPVRCVELDIVFDKIGFAQEFLGCKAKISDSCNGVVDKVCGYTWEWVK